MADKNNAVTDDAQKGCVNANKNMHNYHREAINNDVNINGEKMAEEYYNEENLPPQTCTTTPTLAVTNPSFFRVSVNVCTVKSVLGVSLLPINTTS